MPSQPDCANALFFCLFICLVVRHSKTQSEQASETVVTVTATRLTVTRTPTKVPAAICPQRKPSSWRLQALNHHLWSKVSLHWLIWLHEPNTPDLSDYLFSVLQLFVLTIKLLTCLNAHNLNLYLATLLSPTLFSALFSFNVCVVCVRLCVCLRVWVSVHPIHVLSLSKQTSPLCFYKPNYFSLSI